MSLARAIPLSAFMLCLCLACDRKEANVEPTAPTPATLEIKLQHGTTLYGCRPPEGTLRLFPPDLSQDAIGVSIDFVESIKLIDGNRFEVETEEGTRFTDSLENDTLRVRCEGDNDVRDLNVSNLDRVTLTR